MQPITGLGALSKKALFEETQLDIKQDTYVLSKIEGSFLAAELWLTTFQLDQLVQIAENSVKAVEQQLRDASAMERVGRLNRGDVLKLELAVSEAKMRLTQTMTARATAMANFCEVIGVNPQTSIKLPADLPDFSYNDYPLEKSIDMARNKRLDSKISRNRVELAEFGKSLVYSQFSPQVNVFVKADRNFGDPYVAFPGRISRSVGVNITWDIWNNGSNVFALREAQDLIVKAEEAAKADESRTAIEVQNALSGFNSAKVALNQAMTAVKQADEAFRIESIRFKTGARSATDLIMAESSHAQAKGRLITAKVDLANNYFKYQRSIGYETPKF
jgi:outer membrane protein